MRREFFICLLLAGVTLAIYWPARHYGIIYFDDPLFVTDNRGNKKRPDVAQPVVGAVQRGGRQLASGDELVVCLGHQFFGINPGAEHLVNVIFHAVERGAVVSGFESDDEGTSGAAAWWRRCLRGIRCGWSRWRGLRSARTCCADFFSC